MAKTDMPVALVTGASSGLGNAVATHLAKKGLRVYGTSRNPAQAERKDDEFFELVAMDAGSMESVQSAVDLVLSREGRIDVLVCNAGMGIAGSVEETPLADIERQMDVNFIGAVRAIKAVLPAMRDKGITILVVGSMAGRTGIPFQAFYSASKFALEGFVESLRLELKPFPVRLAIIEPGDFRTGFTAARKTLVPDGSPYARFAKAAIGQMEKDEQNGAWPIDMARLVLKLARAKRLRTRYTVGMPVQRVFMVLKRWLPDGLFELGFAAMYGLLKKAGTEPNPPSEPKGP